MLVFEWEDYGESKCWRLHPPMRIRPLALMINTSACFVRSARIGVREQDPAGITLHFVEAPSRTEPCNWPIIEPGEIVRVVIGSGAAVPGAGIASVGPPSLLALVGELT